MATGSSLPTYLPAIFESLSVLTQATARNLPGGREIARVREAADRNVPVRRLQAETHRVVGRRAAEERRPDQLRARGGRWVQAAYEDVRAAPQRGAFINKAVSYGNACDVDESDLLEHYTADGDVEVIAAYIEGVKDGKRFREALGKAARTKPTIVLKGGKTEAGIATAASHTGALSSSIEVWNAIVRQSGAVPADHLDQLIDLSLLFLYTPTCVGRRIGMVGLGGGVSVLASDAFETYGFSFPDLSEQIKTELLKLSGAPGSIFKNPVDTAIAFRNPDAMEDVLHMLDGWNEVDLLLAHHGYDIPGGGRANLSPAIGKMIDATRVVSKPVALILYCAADPESYKASVEDQQRGWEAGIPSFDSMESAAAALDKFVRHHQRKARHQDDSRG